MKRVQAGVGARESKPRIATKELMQECSARTPETQEKNWRGNGNVEHVGMAGMLESD
jgi:hypothetical protein